MISSSALLLQLYNWRKKNHDSFDDRNLKLGIRVGIDAAIQIVKDLERQTQARLIDNPRLVSSISGWLHKVSKGKLRRDHDC